MRLDTLRPKLYAMQAEEERLKGHISERETEAYWEEKIREHGYRKPGESVVVIKKDESFTRDLDDSAPLSVRPKNFWQTLLKMFKTRF